MWQTYDNVNAVYGAKPDNITVRVFGKTESAALCQAACVADPQGCQVKNILLLVDEMIRHTPSKPINRYTHGMTRRYQGIKTCAIYVMMTCGVLSTKPGTFQDY